MSVCHGDSGTEDHPCGSREDGPGDAGVAQGETLSGVSGREVAERH